MSINTVTSVGTPLPPIKQPGLVIRLTYYGKLATAAQPHHTMTPSAHHKTHLVVENQLKVLYL